MVPPLCVISARVGSSYDQSPESVKSSVCERSWEPASSSTSRTTRTRKPRESTGSSRGPAGRPPSPILPRRGEFADPARRAELPAYAGERGLVVLRARRQELHHDLPPRPVPGEPHHSLSAPAEFALTDVSARQPPPRIHPPAPSPAPGSWPLRGVSATPGPDRPLGRSRVPSHSAQLPVCATHFSPLPPTPATTRAVTTSGRSRIPPARRERGRIKPGHRSRHNLSP